MIPLRHWHWAARRSGRVRRLLRCGFTRPPDHGLEQDFISTECALVFLFRGTLEYAPQGGDSRIVEPGCFFLRLPGRRHHVRYLRGCHCGYLAFPAPLYPLFTEIRPDLLGTPVLRVGHIALFRRRFDALLRLSRQAGAHRPFLMLAPMLALAGELWSRAEAARSATDAVDGVPPTPKAGIPPKPRKSAEGQTVDAFMRLAVEELSECERGIPIAEVAAKLGLGYHAFRKRFKARFGMGPDRYRREALIRKASLLLLDEANRVEAVAGSLGFPDVHTFTRRFKAVMGVSPSRWRERERARN
ncbi:MAG: helix-turn-helix transcriptional regulator [Spirochaetes bacterium]|nr:helix-turn-helix transcriptional regulator [Spirochaetota bacterium]